MAFWASAQGPVDSRGPRLSQGPLNSWSGPASATCPSENSDSEWIDDPDECLDFTPVQRRKSEARRPEAAPHLAFATDGSCYFHIKTKTEEPSQKRNI
ncbi:hypothetical protein EVAR_16282_1 [Eumeta japonica]|uniref:Uncharacterized protein n=1 Tax=Eumeta variegata TaxID=151549 RepID=A0A4C2A3E5_EUMVA|nr:hypothetical protein EVAR_16282_1 [Eumeta japonica]